MRDGILLIDKPSGVTSHDVVDVIRRRFRLKKAGHAGTLDPLATGLLIILLERATKLSQRVMELEKEYLAKMCLDFSTTTGDLAGDILEKSQDKDYLKLDMDFIGEVFAAFTGRIEQVPPMFSAIKYKGQRLYKLARKGIEVKRNPRPVNIYSLRIENISLPEIVFRTRCSRGVYIRQLCVDIGLKLGYPAHLSNMSRTKTGVFELSDAYKLKQVLDGGDIEKYIIPISELRNILRKKDAGYKEG